MRPKPLLALLGAANINGEKPQPLSHSKGETMSVCKPSQLFSAAVALCLAGGANAALVWTGAADGGSLFNEGNFVDTDTNAAPAAGTVDANNAVLGFTGGIIIDASASQYVAGEPGFFGGGTFNFGSNDLLVAGLKLGSFSTFGADGTGSVTIGDGGTVDLQFINTAITVLDGGTLSLRGGNEPLPGGTVELQFGGTVIFTNEDVAAFNNEHLGKFTPVGGTLQVVSDGELGSIITVVPEPGSLALLGLGGLMIARRRR
ncbi:MAG: PEP-CTERM sorting domain-containing protein [Planctomycetota bacterium]